MTELFEYILIALACPLVLPMYEPQESDKWVNFADDLMPIIEKTESKE